MSEERRHPTRIKALRLERNLTQEQVAQLTGYTFTSVHRHETGSRSLDASAIDRYAKVFHVTPAELFVDLDEWDRQQAELEAAKERKKQEKKRLEDQRKELEVAQERSNIRHHGTLVQEVAKRIGVEPPPTKPN